MKALPNVNQGVHFQFCLVGRLLTNRPVHFRPFESMFARVWKPVKGVHVKEMENNVYLFQFFH